LNGVFKNLVVDFVLQAIRFFGGREGLDIPDNAVITPLRQEQQKERLVEGHHEIDTSFLVELPQGEREALVYLIEEETAPRAFSIHRLCKYLAEVAELHAVTRVVPIVIFLRSGEAQLELRLGTEHGTYLFCTYISCYLARLNALDYVDSDNVVARILLPCMHVPEGRRVEIVVRSLEGLVKLEASVQKQRKYTEFVTMYAGLSGEERIQLEQELDHAPWSRKMTGWLSEAEAKGEAKGKAEGEAKLVLRALSRRGLALTAQQEKLVRACLDTAQLERWFDRALTAGTADEVFVQQQ